MSEPAKSFSALYYPYSRCLREIELKRLLLLFDRIYFVDPLSRDLAQWAGQYPVPNQSMHIRIMQDSGRLREEDWLGYAPVYQRGIRSDHSHWDWVEIIDTYAYLQSERIIQLLDPTPVVREHGELIAFALADDLLSGAAVTAGMSYFIDFGAENPRWILHKQRVPPSLSEVLAREEFWESLSSQSTPRSYPVYYARERIERAVAAVSDIDGSAAVLVDYDVAYSLILSQALLLCERHRLFPVTDDGAVHASLVEKAARVALHDRSKEIILRDSFAEMDRLALLGLNVFDRVLPDSALVALSVEDVVRYRQENHEQLSRFWEKMIEIAASCDSFPPDSSFPTELRRVIETAIVPEFKRLQEHLRLTHRRLFSRTATRLVAEGVKAAAPAVPTMSLAALYGLGPKQIVTLGGSALLAGIGVALPNLTEELGEYRALSRSAFAYLVNVPNDPGGVRWRVRDEP